MAFVYGVCMALAVLVLMSLSMSNANKLPIGNHGLGVTSAQHDDLDDDDDFTTASVHAHSGAAKMDLPPQLRNMLPADLRDKPASQLKQMAQHMLAGLKQCTVPKLNLTELTGNWTLVYFSEPLPNKTVDVEFAANTPNLMYGILRAIGKQVQKLIIEQNPDGKRGVLLMIKSVKGTIVGISPLFILAHKRHRYFVSLVVGPTEKSIKWAIYVRIHSKPGKKKTKKLSKSILEEAMAAVRCLPEHSRQVDMKNGMPEPLFHPVL